MSTSGHTGRVCFEYFHTAGYSRRTASDGITISKFPGYQKVL